MHALRSARGETGCLPTAYRYTGQREMGVGFYDYQARLYNPAVCHLPYQEVPAQ